MQRFRSFSCTVEQHSTSIRIEEKIEKDFALGREERGIERGSGREPAHVICDQPLQEILRFRARHGKDRAIRQNGGGAHGS